MPGGIDYSSLVQKHMGNIYSRTNVTTTSSGYSAPSTANQIADALLGVGSMVAMMAIASKAQGGGNQVSAGMSARTTAMTNKAQAQAVIKVFTPKLEQARAQLKASDTNYEASKKELNKQLEDLNKQAGVTGSDTSVNPQVVEYINEAKSQLTTWQANATTFKSNESAMKSLTDNNNCQTCSGNKAYFNVTGDNAKANDFTGADFMKNYGTAPTDPKEKATWESAKTEADSKAQQAKMTANQKAADYNRLSQSNTNIKNALNKGVTVKNSDGTTVNLKAKTPDELVNSLDTHISSLNQTVLNNQQVAANNATPLTAEDYQTKKAEIQGKLNKLEADHNNKKGLEKTIENYEAKIAEAQAKIDEADATIAMLDAQNQQASAIDGQIDQKKAYLKATDQRKKFLGIRIGNNPADVKAMRKQTKAEIADLKNQRSSLS